MPVRTVAGLTGVNPVMLRAIEAFDEYALDHACNDVGSRVDSRMPPTEIPSGRIAACNRRPVCAPPHALKAPRCAGVAATDPHLAARCHQRNRSILPGHLGGADAAGTCPSGQARTESGSWRRQAGARALPVIAVQNLYNIS